MNFKQQRQQDCYLRQIMQSAQARPQLADINNEEPADGNKSSDGIPANDGGKQARGPLVFAEVRGVGAQVAEANRQACGEPSTDNGEKCHGVDDFHVPAFLIEVKIYIYI